MAVTFCTIKLVAVIAWISVSGPFTFLGTLEVKMAYETATSCVVRHAALGGSVALIHVSDGPARDCTTKRAESDRIGRFDSSPSHLNSN